MDAVGAAEGEAGGFLEPLTAESLARCREQMAAAGRALPLSADVDRSDHQVPGGPTVRVHRPVDAEGRLPALLWLHGGGLVMGDRFQDDARFDRWCARHRFVAVTVDYRLAPESPYPAALHDGHAALGWVREQAEVLGVDRDRVAVGGDSAGGGLAVAVTLLAREQQAVPPAFQLLVYPMLDDRQVTPSSRREVPVWSPADNAFGWRSYLGDRAGAPDLEPLAAPARATDLAGLPPTYLMVGTADGFVDECIELGSRLLAAGVPVDLRVHAGLPHGFDVLAPGADTTRVALRDLHDWLGRALRPGGGSVG